MCIPDHLLVPMDREHAERLAAKIAALPCIAAVRVASNDDLPGNSYPAKLDGGYHIACEERPLGRGVSRHVLTTDYKARQFMRGNR